MTSGSVHRSWSLARPPAVMTLEGNLVQTKRIPGRRAKEQSQDGKKLKGEGKVLFLNEIVAD